MTRVVVASFAALTLGLASTAQAGAVDLRISDGRVWLAATNATVGEILGEWARVGRTDIVNGDRIPGGVVSLRLDDVSEPEALDVLLRAAGGYVGVRRPVPGENASQFARLLILPEAAHTIAEDPGPAAVPVFLPPETPSAHFGGVQRIIGPDGQPVPDDQEDAPAQPPAMPPRFPSTPPGFAPVESVPAPVIPTPAPPANDRLPTAPAGAPMPGMVVPAPPSPDQNR